jgi:hypothetical protein
MYCLFCDVLCIVCVYMCTEQLPPGGYPIAVKYILSYISSHEVAISAHMLVGGRVPQLSTEIRNLKNG